MSLTKYELLITAIECGSITAAAEKTGYTQSGVSHMINGLEAELGVKIVTRNRNGVRLTSTGEILYPHIKRVVNDNQYLQQAVSEITGVLKGKLIIGSFSTISIYYLPEVFSKFTAKYPDIEIELIDGTYEEIENMIYSGKVDCGFVSLPAKNPLKTIPVLEDRLMVATGIDYKTSFSDKESVTIDDLLKEKIIMIDSPGSDYDIIRLFGDRFNEMNSKITTRGGRSAINMVAHNLGVGVFPLLLTENYHDSLKLYELAVPFERTLALAYTGKKEVSPVAKRFIEFIETMPKKCYNDYKTPEHAQV